MKAWYFSNKEKQLGYQDCRQIRKGITHKVLYPITQNGITFYKPTLCRTGLHGCVDILSALKYSRGPIIWRVDIRGDLNFDPNTNYSNNSEKFCGKERTYLWGFNIGSLLSKFCFTIMRDSVVKKYIPSIKKDRSKIERCNNIDELLLVRYNIEDYDLLYFLRLLSYTSYITMDMLTIKTYLTQIFHDVYMSKRMKAFQEWNTILYKMVMAEKRRRGIKEYKNK